jgi:hypothetical protein
MTHTLDKKGYTLTRTKKDVILVAYPRQQWFREHASVLRYTYIACLVKCLPNNGFMKSKHVAVKNMRHCLKI